MNLFSSFSMTLTIEAKNTLFRRFDNSESAGMQALHLWRLSWLASLTMNGSRTLRFWSQAGGIGLQSLPDRFNHGITIGVLSEHGRIGWGPSRSRHGAGFS
jgi:hypothetical protein